MGGDSGADPSLGFCFVHWIFFKDKCLKWQAHLQHCSVKMLQSSRKVLWH